MNREDLFEVGKILALALLLGVALVMPFIVGAKIFDAVRSAIYAPEIPEGMGFREDPETGEMIAITPEMWKASVFAQADKLMEDGRLEFEDSGNLTGGEDPVALEDLLYCIRQGFLVYDAAEKRWTLSDRFLEDVADALVPVLKERGFVRVSEGDATRLRSVGRWTIGEVETNVIISDDAGHIAFVPGVEATP